MSTGQRTDVWSSGDAYEPWVGRWSRPVARLFLAWLGVPRGQAWLDVGCGTGALSETILAVADPATLEGMDPSEAYLAHASTRITDPRASFRVGDARELPFADASFDAVVSGLVLNFVPQPERALAEQMRVVRAGGIVAAYVWDYAEGMQLMRHFWDVAQALDPAAADLDEGARFTITRPDRLRNLFTGAGLRDVDVVPLDVPTPFVDFDDYWQPFLGGQGPAPSYLVSLDEARRTELRERLRAALPIQGDGSIPLVARAWAVKGRRA